MVIPEIATVRPSYEQIVQATAAPPLTLEAASKLTNKSERDMALFLCAITHLLVFHEPHLIKPALTPRQRRAVAKKHIQQGTIPDFLVIDTRNDNFFYFEVTRSREIEGGHKFKQRDVMARAKLAEQYYQVPQPKIKKMLKAQRKAAQRKARLEAANQAVA